MPMPVQARRRVPAVALATLLLCAACSKPEPPETDRPPEPQATPEQPAADQGAAGGNATGLRDAIQRPIDRAKAVDGQVEDAAAQQRAAVDAQTGY